MADWHPDEELTSTPCILILPRGILRDPDDMKRVVRIIIRRGNKDEFSDEARAMLFNGT